jgi:hypothetical protein
MVALAFEVISEHPRAEDVTPDQLRAALARRVKSLGDDPVDWKEACLPPDGTHEVETVPEAAPEGELE